MMHYLAFVDEAEGLFGISVPDCPGCVAMGSNFEEAVGRAEEALRDWMSDRVASGLKPPPARTLAELRTDPTLAEDFAAHSIVATIPLALASKEAHVSLDVSLLDAIDEAARARGLTRSAFLASAAREKIAASH